MKTPLLICLLAIAHICSAQPEKSIPVPGTKCSLVPPAGFSAATSFAGFQQAETGSTIMVNEIPAPYESIVGGFTAEALKSRGMTLISKDTIRHNGEAATILVVTQPANGTVYFKQMLVFGYPGGTVLVNGIYPESAKHQEAEIKRAVLSTTYTPAANDNPLEAVRFTVDVQGTDFKLAKALQGNLVYTTDGKIPTEKPSLVVGNSIAKVLPTNQKRYAEERLKKLPRGEFNVIKETREITIDNLEGYEIVASGKSRDGKEELVYQVILFNDSGDYYIILGQAKESFEPNLATFRKIASTFKRR